MDYEESFLTTVKSTIDALRRKDRKPREWEDDEGRKVEGWEYESRPYSNEVPPTPTSRYWRESWGSTTSILATDGSFWSFSHSSEQTSERPETHVTVLLSPVSLSFLVGRRGKPFSEVKAKIERLPYI